MSRRDLVFRSTELEDRLRPVCEEVLKHFQAPDTRLLCFLDDEDTSAMTGQIGQLYCGIFGPVQGNSLHFPEYLLDLFMNYNVMPSEFRYDQFIYVRNKTCQTVPGTVITLAHELTHCRQRNTAAKVWWANSLLYQHLGDMDPAALFTTRAWNIPHEHEAQLNSRRIAIELLGEAIVDAYAVSKIQDNYDPDKWRFFRSLSTSATFNLLEETRPWVDRYRTGLQMIPQNIEPEHQIDFTKPDWWV